MAIVQSKFLTTPIYRNSKLRVHLAGVKKWTLHREDSAGVGPQSGNEFRPCSKIQSQTRVTELQITLEN